MSLFALVSVSLSQTEIKELIGELSAQSFLFCLKGTKQLLKLTGVVERKMTWHERKVTAGYDPIYIKKKAYGRSDLQELVINYIKA